MTLQCICNDPNGNKSGNDLVLSRRLVIILTSVDPFHIENNCILIEISQKLNLFLVVRLKICNNDWGTDLAPNWRQANAWSNDDQTIYLLTILQIKHWTQWVLNICVVTNGPWSSQRLLDHLVKEQNIFIISEILYPPLSYQLRLTSIRCTHVTVCICDLHISNVSENVPVPDTQSSPDHQLSK